MCINRTFSELNGSVVSNGAYSVRFVMENDSPRFVLTDVMSSLGYRSPGGVTNHYCHMYGLGKVVGKDNLLRTYASKDEAEQIFDHLYLMTSDFRKFWEEEVVPETDRKYAQLKSAVNKEKETNKKLTEIYHTLKKQNSVLTGKIDALLKEHDAINSILGNIA